MDTETKAEVPQQLNTVRLHEIVSSKLVAIGYERSTETLAIKFPPRPGEVEGPIYNYFGFPVEQWEAFQSAESKGSFFYKSIKGRYDFQRIEPITGEKKVVVERDEPPKEA